MLRQMSKPSAPGRPMSRMIEPRAHRLERQQRVLARAHPGDPVAGLLEIGADERADRLLVLHEQELRPRRARWVELRRARRGHLRVARTSFAGASPSRITVATIPRRSAEYPIGCPLIVIAAVGATGIGDERAVPLQQRQRPVRLVADDAAVDPVVVEDAAVLDDHLGADELRPEEVVAERARQREPGLGDEQGRVDREQRSDEPEPLRTPRPHGRIVAGSRQHVVPST